MAGKPAITKGKDAINQFEDKVNAIVDGGKTKIGIPSSIIKIEKENIIVLREGPISKDKIEKEIKNVRIFSYFYN